MKAAERAGEAVGKWLAGRMLVIPALRPLNCWIGLRNLEHRGVIKRNPDGSVAFRWHGEEHILSASEWQALMNGEGHEQER